MISRRAKIAVLGIILLAGVLPWPHPGHHSHCDSPPWEFAHGIIAYIYALKLESAWRAARPRTRLELERHLHLYSTRTIVPAESCWARNYKLKAGESMLQYEILWHAPLDVVYDQTGRIVMIITSYE